MHAPTTHSVADCTRVEDDLPLARLLIVDHGADVTARSRVGTTVMSVACGGMSFEVGAITREKLRAVAFHLSSTRKSVHSHVNCSLTHTHTFTCTDRENGVGKWRDSSCEYCGP